MCSPPKRSTPGGHDSVAMSFIPLLELSLRVSKLSTCSTALCAPLTQAKYQACVCLYAGVCMCVCMYRQSPLLTESAIISARAGERQGERESTERKERESERERKERGGGWEVYSFFSALHFHHINTYKM